MGLQTDRRGAVPHPRGSVGAEGMRLALDVLEGQNFGGKHHHGVGPRRAGAAELAAVDALDLAAIDALDSDGRSSSGSSMTCRRPYPGAAEGRGSRGTARRPGRTTAATAAWLRPALPPHQKPRDRRAAMRGCTRSNMMGSGALYPRLNKLACGLKAET
jgi:hypothetical protein